MWSPLVYVICGVTAKAFAYLDLCYISCLPYELIFANLGQVAQSRVELIQG